VEVRAAGVRLLAVLVAGLLVVGGDGCGRTEEATTDVSDAAAALRREGLAYDVSETAVLGTIGAEGLRLTGPGLEVELYVLNERDHRDLALTAVARLAAGQRSRGEPFPAQGFAAGDLFVLVRKEPVEGRVRRALERVLAAAETPDDTK